MKIMAQGEVGNGVVRVLEGDITLAETDAIVNAANSWLQHGGGVAAAIVRRGGPTIQQESDAAGFIPEGQVAVTGGGDLKARYVIHAVGPRGGDPQGDDKLRSAVEQALQAAEDLGLATISFPAISSGIFGFPKTRCAEILVQTAAEHLREHPKTTLKQVDFVLFDEETARLFEEQLGQQAPPSA